MLHDLNSFKIFEICCTQPRTACLSVTALCTLEKNMHSAVMV